jgi:cytochrome o ubiquinol oxidase subunit IV
MTGTHSSAHQEHQSHGSLKSYVIGFVLSIVLTIIPLALVMGGMLNKTATILAILLMAGLQFAVQLFFFMHLKEGENAHWNIMALIIGIIMIVMVVGGSIWIMFFNQVAH